MMTPEEIQTLLKECNVYINKDNIAVIQINERDEGVYDVYIYTVNGATIDCILSKKEKLVLIRTEPITVK